MGEKKIGNKVRKLTNFREKRTFWAKKNKLGLSLRRKKDYLGQKWGKKLGIRARNLPIFKKKRKRLFGSKKQAGAGQK